MPGYTFCSGFISSVGAIVTSTGQVTFTSTRVSTGLYTITFNSPHPLGVAYILNLTAQSCNIVCSTSPSPPLASSFSVACYALGTARKTDCYFYFMVLA